MSKIPGENSFPEQIQQWASASETGDTGDPIETPQNIQDWINSNWQDIGTVYSDEASLPPTAEPREQLFFDHESLMRHWINSGLIYWDEHGNVVPNPMIAIVEMEDDLFGPYVKVYIDYDG